MLLLRILCQKEGMAVQNSWVDDMKKKFYIISPSFSHTLSNWASYLIYLLLPCYCCKLQHIQVSSGVCLFLFSCTILSSCIVVNIVTSLRSFHLTANIFSLNFKDVSPCSSFPDKSGTCFLVNLTVPHVVVLCINK